ncbi:hypothetical protein RISK_005453 [Rhodopirellula islandica]|uniref:Uncharacterized protein n=1 Tax=Rhodopirellula islandica TaxID=595434 RepID=A0A0J1B6P4_RHOIS|nr:hypothetical protein RISK_005453 [Rhodopirellula islandica]
MAMLMLTANLCGDRKADQAHASPLGAMKFGDFSLGVQRLASGVATQPSLGL